MTDPGGGWPGSGVAARLDRLASLEEIRQLPARYAAALDARDLDSLVGLFVADVRVGRGRFGREALREAFFDAPLREVGVTHLQVGNHVIDLDGPHEARGVVYCRAEMQQTGTSWISQAIHYGDTYRRVSGRWYFARRDHQLFYGVELGRRPLDQEPANWPEHATGTGTLPAAWPSWQRFWSTAPHDTDNHTNEGGSRDGSPH